VQGRPASLSAALPVTTLGLALFFVRKPPYSGTMDNADDKRQAGASPMGDGGPWGNPDEDKTARGNREGPRNPWTPPPRGSGNGPNGARGPSVIDEMIRRARDSFGGGLPDGPGSARLWIWGGLAVVALWFGLTSFHSIGAKQRGVVSFLGSYSRTLEPGFRMTLPTPLESVTVVETDQIRSIELGSASDSLEKLMLTGDQNVINIGYSVLWKVADPKAYLFQIAKPDETIAEVAESAMRAVVATVRLQDALGAGRNDIEQRVQLLTQQILDQYNAGVEIERVAIKQADPPEAVNDAFKEVSAAQQDADTYINQANAYAQQLSAQSQGEAQAFDKVYEQYRLAPDVTRRRMYYETMERVLSGVNKTVIEANGVTSYLPLPQMAPRRPSVTTVETVGGRP
jgi:modulator of FtsH protease HflK